MHCLFAAVRCSCSFYSKYLEALKKLNEVIVPKRNERLIHLGTCKALRDANEESAFAFKTCRSQWRHLKQGKNRM